MRGELSRPARARARESAVVRRVVRAGCRETDSAEVIQRRHGGMHYSSVIFRLLSAVSDLAWNWHIMRCVPTIGMGHFTSQRLG